MLVEFMEEKDPLSCVEELTDKELKNLQLRIAKIMDARAEEKRTKLINNFEDAFNALKDIGIDIIIEHYNEETGDYFEYEVDLSDIRFE